MANISYIDLLRHGETENSNRFNGSTNNPLTEYGWTQMEASVEETSIQWQHIITSPLIRCASFAQSFAERHTIPMTQDERFREIHFGDWEGQSSEELMHTDADALSLFWRNPIENPPPQAEHLLDFRARVLSAWTDINADFEDKNILLVTHSGVIRTLLCHIQQQPIERLMELEVEHGAIKRIQITKYKNSQQTTLI
jgi:alpha-ribazole phosphatase